MSQPPALDPRAGARPVTPRTALLVNPFYPKDPHASFGKHVLTPTLALTSFAAATPAALASPLLGREPPRRTPALPPHARSRRHHRPSHFRQTRLRARPLVPHPRQQSRPRRTPRPLLPRRVRPPRRRPRARRRRPALAPHPRRRRSRPPRLRYAASYENDYRDDPPPRRALLHRSSFLTTTSLIATRGCHNRCGFCYLATDGLRMPYRMRDPEQIAAEFAADDQPYAVFIDNNLGSRPDYLRALCLALRPLERSGAPPSPSTSLTTPRLVRDMALAGCTGVFVGFESLTDENLVRRPQENAPHRRLRPARPPPPRQRHPGQRLFRPRLRSRPQGRLRGDRRMDRTEPPRVRHLPHPHALSRHPALPPDGIRRPPPPPRLEPLRHRPRRLPSPAHDARRARRRLRLDLPPALLPHLHLAPPSRRLARRPALLSHVLLI